MALGLDGIPLCQGLPYGTILAEVVAHRMLLLVSCTLNREYTMRQQLKCPFHNNLKNCPVVNLRGPEPVELHLIIIKKLSKFCTESFEIPPFIFLQVNAGKSGVNLAIGRSP